MERASAAVCERLEQRQLLSADFYVAPAPTGSDTTGTGSSTSPWATINHAVNTATLTSNTIIHVEPGTYRETINLKALTSTEKTTIIAASGQNTVYIEGTDILNKSWSAPVSDGHGGNIYTTTYTPPSGQYPQEVLTGAGGTFLAEKGIEGDGSTTGALSDRSSSGEGRAARVADGTAANSSLWPYSFYYNITSDLLAIDLPTGTSPSSTMEISTRDQWVPSLSGTNDYDFESLNFRYSNGGAFSHGGFMEPSLMMPAGSTVNSCIIAYAGFSDVNANTNTVISNSQIIGGGDTGIQAAGNSTNLSIHDNVIQYNNFRHFDVSWAAGGIKLITSSSGGVEEGKVYNNDFGFNYGEGFWSDSNRDTSTSPLLFYDNYVHDNAPVSTDYYPNYDPSGEAGVKIEVSDWVRVFNNVVANNYPNGITIVASQDTVVYNNTLYGNRGFAALAVGFTHRELGGTGTNMPVQFDTIENNLIYNNYTSLDLMMMKDGSESSGTLDAGNNTCDYNMYYRFGGALQLSDGNEFGSEGTSYWTSLGAIQTTLSAWQTFSGRDTHGVSASPKLFSFSGASVQPGSTSPADGAGLAVNLAGNGSVTTDYAGTTRTSPYDIGAYQHSGSAGPIADAVTTTTPAPWVDDALPAGAVPVSFKDPTSTTENNQWQWYAAGQPTQRPFVDMPSVASQSGLLSAAPDLISSSNFHAMTFDNATTTLTVTPTDTINAYVYLDPSDTPGEIMLQFEAGSKWYRASWGTGISSSQYDVIEQTYTSASTSHNGGSTLPATGSWQLLQIPVSAFISTGSLTIKGLSLDTLNGQAAWDTIGTGDVVDRWSLNEGSGTTAVDSAGSNNATLVGTANWRTTGKSGGDFYFDGSSYFNAGNSTNLNLGTTTGSQMSIGAWMYLNAGDPTVAVGIDKSGSYRLVAENDASNPWQTAFQFFVTDSAGVTHTCQSPLSLLYNDNVFHYVVGTYDGNGNMTLYVDNVAVATTPWSGATTLKNNTNPLTLGERDYPLARYFLGELDEVTLYNKALSSADVNANYVSYGGAPGLPSAPTGLVASVPAGTTTVNLTWVDHSSIEDSYEVWRSSDGITYTQLANLPRNSTSYTDTTLGTNGSAYYQVYAATLSGVSGSNVSGARTGEVGSWAMDEGSGSTTADSSGNGHTGTLMSSPTWVSGEFGDALSFNGTTQYVEIPAPTGSNLNISGAMSIGGWFNMNTTGGTNSTGIDKQWSYRIVADSANATMSHWQVMFTDSGNTSDTHLLDSTTAVSNGQWHYVVGTYDGAGTEKLYIDGQPQGSFDWAGTGVPLTLNVDTNPFEIGRRDQFRYYAGSIDQVQILNRALSASEILNEYNLSSGGVHTDIVRQAAAAPATTATGTAADDKKKSKASVFSVAQQIGLAD